MLKKYDSKLSKVIKFIVRSLIYIAAAVVLVTCIVLNLIISLIPGLVFYCINKDMFSQKNIENDEGQTVNKVEVNNGGKYNKRVEEEVNNLGQQDDVEQDQSGTDLCKPLMRSSQLDNQPIDNQPTIKVISRVVEGKQTVDETVIAKNINNNIQDGEMMMRTIGNDRNFTVRGVVTGNATNRQEGFATAMGLSCNIVENGIDMQFDCSCAQELKNKKQYKH